MAAEAGMVVPAGVDEARFRRAIEAIDAANADDPVTITVGGEERPKELTHAAMLTHWVSRLDPDAGEALLLAVRAHHIRRWTVPRSTYPDGRSGYLRWRRDLQEFHANEAARILREAGYGDDLITRVGQIIRKQRLRSDSEVQILEDGLALVFLETQFEELDERLPDETMVDVIRKTWRKMSARGQEIALELPLTEETRHTILSALDNVSEA